MLTSPKDCAREVLDVVPLVMRSIRAEIRRNRANDLSLPQFRTLIFLNRNPGAQLSNLAEHLGLTPPSASKLIDGLVVKQLVQRQASLTDRRCITLALTPAGKNLLDASYQETQASFTPLFAGLSESDRSKLIQSLQLLRHIFSGGEGDRVMGGTYASSGN